MVINNKLDTLLNILGNRSFREWKVPRRLADFLKFNDTAIKEKELRI